jgi:hypothetical protein
MLLMEVSSETVLDQGPFSLFLRVIVYKKFYRAECQWLMPVILATWEAEMGDCSSKPAQAKSENLPQPKSMHNSNTSVISSYWGTEIGRIVVPG